MTADAESPRTELLDDDLIRSLVDAAPDGILMTDAAGRLELVNRKAEELFGYERGALLGRPVDDLLPVRFREIHRAHRSRYQEHPHSRAMGVGMQLVGRRADGSEFPVEISLSPIHADDGVRVIAAIRDITQRLEAEERQQRAEQELRLVEDRERTARDLHDLVIQRLFAAGMTLQMVLGLADHDERNRRVEHVIDEIDETIREIRTVIFGLQSPTIASGHVGLRRQVLDVVDEQRAALGCTPSVVFAGAVDTTDDGLARQLVAALRELLSNVSRHASARNVSIAVDGSGDEIAVCVTDDGVGFDANAPSDGNGLRNLYDRARQLGGSFTVTASPVPGSRGTGTVAAFRVPWTHDAPRPG